MREHGSTGDEWMLAIDSADILIAKELFNGINKQLKSEDQRTNLFN